MPPYYIGGGVDHFAGFGKPPMPGPPRTGGPLPAPGFGGDLKGKGQIPGSPPTSFPGLTPAATPAMPAPGSVLGAQAIRPTGDAKGYDPSYLQNLATAIGGLFSRPQGNLNFNPLGNLSEISPSSGIGGNAPLPGLPSTWLQDALNGLGFSFAPPAPPASTRPANRGGGNGGGGRGPGRMLNEQ
jgi:hypothetical protein